MTSSQAGASVTEDTATRADLPRESLFLLNGYPRSRWQKADTHPTAMRWLEVHDWFRAVPTEIIRVGEEWRCDCSERVTHAASILRPLERFLEVLDWHHCNESALYFPLLSAADERLALAVSMLEADHASLNGALAQLAAAAGVLRQGNKRDAVARALYLIERLDRRLKRHFADEEDIVIPFLSLRGDPVFGPPGPTAR